MAGPNSAPNGDKRLVSNEMICEKHGENDKNCNEKCLYIRYREWLARKNQLVTGKTAHAKGLI